MHVVDIRLQQNVVLNPYLYFFLNINQEIYSKKDLSSCHIQAQIEQMKVRESHVCSYLLKSTELAEL